MSEDDFETRLLEKLSEIFERSQLSEITFKSGDCEIQFKRKSRLGHIESDRASPALTAAPAAVTVEPSAPTLSLSGNPGNPSSGGYDQSKTVKSPMVGTAYLSPEPGASPFIKPGDEVRQGQTLMILEAMKVMNPLLSPRSGTVESIEVSDGDPVEFDQPLVIFS